MSVYIGLDPSLYLKVLQCVKTHMLGDSKAKTYLMKLISSYFLYALTITPQSHPDTKLCEDTFWEIMKAVEFS